MEQKSQSRPGSGRPVPKALLGTVLLLQAGSSWAIPSIAS